MERTLAGRTGNAGGHRVDISVETDGDSGWRRAGRARSRSCYCVAMELDAPSGVSRSQVNPNHIVPVTNFSADTLWSIIAHMEVSTDFEHLVYREAELDAIWSITGFFLVNEPDSNQLEAVRRLHAGAHKAHDLVANRRPAEAAVVLRSFL
jgi:hypothetical protein